MTDATDPAPLAERGELVCDGTGRARLKFGAVFFETVFQPAYRVDEGILRPDFATARLRPEGEGSAPGVLARLADGPGPAQAAALARRNLAFLDPESLCFCDDHRLSAAVADASLTLMLEAARDAFMMPDQLVWRLPADLGSEATAAIGRAREAGVRIAIRMNGGDPALALAKVAGYGAQMLHLGVEWSGAWLENIPDAQRLLRSLADWVRPYGCGVSLTGISTAGQLDVALGAGVRWVQGGYLAPAVAAGRTTGWQVLNAAALRRQGGNISVLKRRQTPRHQQY